MLLTTVSVGYVRAARIPGDARHAGGWVVGGGDSVTIRFGSDNVL